MSQAVEVKHHREHDAEVDVDDSDDGDHGQVGGALRFRFSWRKLWRFAGPGWLMSLAYLDPGNLESSLQLGAYTQFSLVWVLFWATVMGLVLQEMSARLGLVTGRDLAQMVRAEYPRWMCYFVYAMMEIAVIGADIQEVVGSGVALNLLTGMPVWVGCLITGIDTFTFLAVQYLGVRYLEALIVVLIGTMSLCFFINWGASDVDAGLLIRGWLVPSMPSYALTLTVGTVGAVIMPHNLYLHSGLVLSRKVRRTSEQSVHSAIWYARIESAGALLFAFFINLAVIATNSATFFAASCTGLVNGPFACLRSAAFNRSGDNRHMIADGQGTPCATPASVGGALDGRCGEIGLSSEGYALADSLGPSSLYIWAVGLLAAGQASTMVCTYAGQIIMGGCLQLQLAPWKRVALTRAFALGPALLVAVGTGSDTSLFNNINEYLNVLQSVQLPFAMLPVLHFAGSQRVMGRFASGPILFAISASLALLVLAINVQLIIEFMRSPPAINADDGEGGSIPPSGVVIVALCAIVYFYVCARLVGTELAAMVRWLAAFGRRLGPAGVPPHGRMRDDHTTGSGEVTSIAPCALGGEPSSVQPAPVSDDSRL